MPNMPCRNDGCRGFVDTDRELMVESPSGPMRMRNYHRCEQCGRVHDKSGLPFTRESGEAVFVKDGKVTTASAPKKRRERRPA